MRIALICDGFRALGGVQEVVAQLAAELAGAGHSVAIGSTPFASPGCDRTVPPGVECAFVTIEGRKPVAWRHPERLLRRPAIAELEGLLRKWRPDVVNSHVWHWSEFPTVARACRAAGVPMVQSLYDSWGDGGSDERALSALGSARALTVLSEATRRHFAPLVPAVKNAPAMLGGADWRAADAAAPFDRARHYIFCAARLDLRHKAIDDLLEAYAAMLPDHPDVDLLIAGDGPDRERLQAQSSALKLGRRVEFVGEISRARLWSLYKGAALFAMPSRLPEGLGLVFLESMACGRPVIGTLSGGVPEVVRDGVDGFLVPPNDRAALAAALHRMLADSDARERMGESGRAIVRERYGWEQVADRFLHVYRESVTPGVGS